MNAPLSDAIQEFVASRRARGIKPSTVRGEHTTLKQLLGVTGNIAVKNLTGRHIDMYFGAYPHLSPGTWNKNMGYLSGFFAWCRSRKYMARDYSPLEGIKKRPVAPRDFIFLPVERFPEAVAAARNGRDRAMVAIGLYSLQRASEMARLTWDDVKDTDPNPSNWTIGVYRSKNETRDDLPLCLELRDELRRWRMEYGTIMGESVKPWWKIVPPFERGAYTNDQRGRLIRTGPQRLAPMRQMNKPQEAVHPVLNALGYEVTTQEGAHTLRRSGGKALYDELAWNRGHDGAIRIVQSMFGHKSLATTEHYLRLTLERKRRNDLLSGATMFPTRTAEVTRIAQEDDRGLAVRQVQG